MKRNKALSEREQKLAAVQAAENKRRKVSLSKAAAQKKAYQAALRGLGLDHNLEVDAMDP